MHLRVDLLIVCVVFIALADATYPSFDEYCQLADKQYSGDEYDEHIAAYTENIERLMTSHESHDTLGIGPFTDISMAEFNKRMMIPRHVPLIGGNSPSKTENGPDTFDWRDRGAVGEIKDQGTVGTCWAFSTTGCLEGQNFLKNGELLSLSEEQLVDCDYLDCGVFGGWPLLAYQYIKNAGGIEVESDFPYCCGTGKCYPCMPNKNTTFCGPPPEYCDLNCTADPSKFKVSVSSWRNISQNEEEIAQELVNVGPLSVLINADMLQFHHSGVWDPASWLCDPESLDHAVLIIGYGVHKGILEDKPYCTIFDVFVHVFRAY